MITLILAGVLFALALYSGYSALNLVPTDLGFAWMNGAFIFLAGSLIVLALRFAAARIEKRLATMQASIAAVMAAGLLPDMDGEAPAPRIEPAFTAQDDARPGAAVLAGAGALVAGGALLSAGAAAAGSQPETDAPEPVDATGQGMSDDPVAPDIMQVPLVEPVPLEALPDEAATRGAAIEDSFITELERDIFAEFPVLKGEAPVTTPAETPDDPDADILEAPQAEPVAIEDTPSPVPDDTGDAIPEKVETPDMVESGQAQESGSETAATSPQDVPDDTPADVPAPQPGLIADEDLAALEGSEPPLAPLETLEIVGAYDSGGTRFTMYSDGSVTASGPTLDRRFPSLDALRAFIDGGAKG